VHDKIILIEQSHKPCEFSIGVPGTGCTHVFAVIVLAIALFILNYLMAGWFYLAKEILIMADCSW